MQRRLNPRDFAYINERKGEEIKPNKQNILLYLINQQHQIMIQKTNKKTAVIINILRTLVEHDTTQRKKGRIETEPKWKKNSALLF